MSQPRTLSTGLSLEPPAGIAQEVPDVGVFLQKEELREQEITDLEAVDHGWDNYSTLEDHPNATTTMEELRDPARDWVHTCDPLEESRDSFGGHVPMVSPLGVVN